MNARAEFMVEPGANQGLRRTALVLFSAQREDQDWLLAQLEPAHRAALETMMAELSGLGITRNRAVVDEVLRNASVSAVPDAGPGPAPVVRSAAEQALLVARAASPGDLAEVLRSEPASLAAHALAHLPVHERTRCLALLALPLRREVHDKLHSHYRDLAADGTVHLAPRQSQALLKELAARLGPPKARVSWLQRLSAWRPVLRNSHPGEPA
jgi:hypothetical protein